ncbi:MFS transporter [Anaerocolumna sp.]|uniref:MFS transporter n=1 Tax=Anaerocolumna sp. TaxID=2041569 RepID=UPI0028AF79D9|nr:MFS transporter [Anaerocolumna sp.]
MKATRLNYVRTFFIGFAFLSICAFWQLYDNIIPLILSNTFHLDEILTGVIMALDNVLALFLLPLFGAFSDRINTKLGKRTPFIIVGTLFAVLFMMFIPYANKTHNFMLFFISLGVVLIAMGSYRSPAVALMPDVTPKPLRSKANAVINLMGTLGAIYTLIMVKLTIPKVEHPDYTLAFLAIAIVMVVAIIILVANIRENALAKEMAEPNTNEEANEEVETVSSINEDSKTLPPEVKKSLFFILASIFLWFTAYNAVITAFSRYTMKVWNLQGGGFADPLIVATGAATISYIPIGFLSSKFGRKKTILGGIILVTVSYLCGTLFITYSPLINVVFAVTGIGWAAINVNSYPMVVEMVSGSDVGKYTGLYYIFSMLAQTLTPIMSGAFLKISYRTLFPYAFVFSVLSFCTMLFVKHGDSKPIRKASTLEEFD